jgi:cysteinyl-tRNA synthetase
MSSWAPITAAGNAGGALSKEEIEKMIQARAEAKAAKNFAEADRIRKELAEKGVAIKDSPAGTTWQYSS